MGGESSAPSPCDEGEGEDMLVVPSISTCRRKFPEKSLRDVPCGAAAVWDFSGIFGGLKPPKMAPKSCPSSLQVAAWRPQDSPSCAKMCSRRWQEFPEKSLRDVPCGAAAVWDFSGIFGGLKPPKMAPKSCPSSLQVAAWRPQDSPSCANMCCRRWQKFPEKYLRDVPCGAAAVWDFSGIFWV